MENLSNAELMSKSTPIVCEKCGCDRFKEIIFLRRVSKLLIGATNDGIIPIPTFACQNCGNVNEEFTPRGADEKKEEPKSNLIL